MTYDSWSDWGSCDKASGSYKYCHRERSRNCVKGDCDTMDNLSERPWLYRREICHWGPCKYLQINPLHNIEFLNIVSVLHRLIKVRLSMIGVNGVVTSYVELELKREQEIVSLIV